MKRFGAISGLRARLLPMNKLRLVAPTNILDAASRVTTALTTTALYTTDPLAQQVAPEGGWRGAGRTSPTSSVRRSARTSRLPCSAVSQFPTRTPIRRTPLTRRIPAEEGRVGHPPEGLSEVWVGGGPTRPNHGTVHTSPDISIDV